MKHRIMVFYAKTPQLTSIVSIFDATEPDKFDFVELVLDHQWMINFIIHNKFKCIYNVDILDKLNSSILSHMFSITKS
jgi:hypothetical protein